ncbi:hypothetical protein WT27_32030 [Burkholderia territorii]|uniref:Uncharacterized protein n=1 Tax=Burkholderia territorii TaxID=1503055 RepID=A0A105VKR8_9BURK|nr:LPO_1073/Vpar_1526 family protein [Burkholderia territorii]KVV49575.1 hypothetical protein WT27_32030 [Burkholderia territorii]KVX36674.1 hypothetical protein WT31_04810 [Burkholderia territorii]
MIFRRKQQALEGRDNSTNIQAARDVTVITNDESAFRAIATEVFNENMMRYARDAADLAVGRATRLVDDYIAKQSATDPQGFEQAAQPDFQAALFEAQKAFARAGDEELETLLVDLLVERAGEPSRNLRQIVLNESIEVVSRLTQAHIELLTFIFITKYTSAIYRNLGDLVNRWKFVLEKTSAAFVADHVTCTYLDYVGVASVHVLVGSSAWQPLLMSAAGFVSSGFSESVVQPLIDRDYRVRPLLRKSARNPKFVEFDVNSLDHLKKRVTELGISAEIGVQLEHIFNSHLLPENEQILFISANFPEYEVVANAWQKLQIGGTTLTPVGFAIAHSNVKKLGLPIGPLSVWV